MLAIEWFELCSNKIPFVIDLICTRALSTVLALITWLRSHFFLRSDSNVKWHAEKVTGAHDGNVKLVEELLNAGADASKTNGRGLTPLDAVTIEMDAELIGIYRFVYESLSLELDLDDVISKRRQIAELLSMHLQQPDVKTDSSKVMKPLESN